MKKVKILTIVLAIILVTLIAFGGIYLPTQNRMENKVKDYELGRELDSQRVIELKIKKLQLIILKKIHLKKQQTLEIQKKQKSLKKQHQQKMNQQKIN